MLGYSRTCSAKSAAPPVRRIRRLTTIESIGRRMKRSVKRILPDSCLDQARHLDLSAGLNAKLALRHDDVARLQATGDNDTVTDTPAGRDCDRSEEHTSELQSLLRISYAVFCLK